MSAVRQASHAVLFEIRRGRSLYCCFDYCRLIAKRYDCLETRRGNEMSGPIPVRPSEDLSNNYEQISALTGISPVAITVNGKEDTVIMSYGDYLARRKRISELEAKIALYEHLAQATDDIKLGRVQDSAAVFDEILSGLETSRV